MTVSKTSDVTCFWQETSHVLADERAQYLGVLRMFKSFKMVKFKTFHSSSTSFKTWRRARGTGLLPYIREGFM